MRASRRSRASHARFGRDGACLLAHDRWSRSARPWLLGNGLHHRGDRISSAGGNQLDILSATASRARPRVSLRQSRGSTSSCWALRTRFRGSIVLRWPRRTTHRRMQGRVPGDLSIERVGAASIWSRRRPSRRRHGMARDWRGRRRPVLRSSISALPSATTRQDLRRHGGRPQSEIGGSAIHAGRSRGR